MVKNFTFGTDPEFFIINAESKDILSSIYLINGNKSNPEPLEVEGYSILKDNVLVEGNVPPTRTIEGFKDSILTLKELIRRKLNSLGYDIEFNLLEEDSAIINPMFLTHPEALEFGCEPYLNAWSGAVCKADALEAESFRTAGFHVHLGYDIESGSLYGKYAMNKAITRAFDIFVVIPSLFINFCAKRFVNYGGLGQYRETSYGVECRSLGAYFLKDEMLDWVGVQLSKCLDFIQTEDNVTKLLTLRKPEIQIEGNSINVEKEVYDVLNINVMEQILTSKSEYDVVYI